MKIKNEIMINKIIRNGIIKNAIVKNEPKNSYIQTEICLLE